MNNFLSNKMYVMGAKNKCSPFATEQAHIDFTTYCIGK